MGQEDEKMRCEERFAGIYGKEPGESLFHHIAFVRSVHTPIITWERSQVSRSAREFI